MPTEQRNDGPERLWTAEEVATLLGLHVQTVYEKAKAGEIPSLKLGAIRRFRPSEIQAWIDAKAKAAVEAVERAS